MISYAFFLLQYLDQKSAKMSATRSDLQNKTGPSKNKWKLEKLEVFQDNTLSVIFFADLRIHLPPTVGGWALDHTLTQKI